MVPTMGDSVPHARWQAPPTMQLLEEGRHNLSIGPPDDKM
jgi:hypothetical protein